MGNEPTIQEIRERHIPRVGWTFNDAVCSWCSEDSDEVYWPCDTAIVLAELARQESVARYG